MKAFVPKYMWILAGSIVYLTILFVQFVSDRDLFHNNDLYEQTMVGKSLWEGNGITLDGRPYVVLPPGFSLMIGGVDRVIRDLDWSGKIITFVSFLLSLSLVYRIASTLLQDASFAVLSVVLFATNSNLILNATGGRSEALFTLIFLALVILTLNFRKEAAIPMTGVFFFSFLWAFLYYVRPEGLLVGGILWLWSAGQVSLFSRRVLFVALTPLLCLVFLFPYLLFLREQTGQWLLSGKTYVNLVLGELKSPYQTGEDADKNVAPRYLIIDRVVENPKAIKSAAEYARDPENDLPQRIPHNFFRLGSLYVMNFSYFGCFLVFLGAGRFSARESIFLISLFSVVFLYLIFFILPRSVAVFHWIVFMFLTAGLHRLKHLLMLRMAERRAYVLVCVITGIFAAYQMRSVLKVSYFYLFS